MKIKSNLAFNTSVYANHSGSNTIGSNIPESVVIPAGATLELEDSKWKAVRVNAQALIDTGALTILEDVKLTAEEQEKADAEELKVLEAKANSLKKKKKAKDSGE